MCENLSKSKTTNQTREYAVKKMNIEVTNFAEIRRLMNDAGTLIDSDK